MPGSPSTEATAPKGGLPSPRYARGMAAAGAYCGGVDRTTFRRWVKDSPFLRQHMRIIANTPYWSFAILDRFMSGEQNHPDEKTRFLGKPKS